MLTAPRSLDAGLGLCPSAPHRALLGLLRVALDGPGEGPDSAALVADLRASSPETIVQLAFDASLHVVLASAFDRDPALRSAVPRDLIVFSQEMRAANLRRNQEIHAQLLEIGVAFAQAGLRGVALKGAAELLCPVYPDPGLRFLSDIDILLPADDVTRASQCLLDIGAVPDPEAQAELIGHHHEAPLGRPDWPVAVELHRAVGHGPAAARLLPPADLLGAAVATAETGLSVPAPAHRLAHAVLHAQYHGPCQRCRLLSPRDAMEFHVLSLGCAAREAEAARARFAVGPDRIAWDALDAARRVVFGLSTTEPALAPGALAWAARALDLYGRPRRARLRAAAGSLLAVLSDLARDPVRRRHRLRQLLRPRRLGRAIAHHGRKLLGRR